ncbi:macrolide 2'-phosphotransferase [Brevibacterium sp. UCMA 11754]|uniref:macrolide 2'-phosphotransferase n=1 Tax=Brevibacterium sp. UCMA 11754 TaxID=2749198 RepID=UPI001F2D7B5E|nr:macrolide 2'-phosphotransferase [Brevibacterium sp. UCMA 11754]MCF2571232.1 macrolide 2'-phosphotransferase [Brevibacterium sp. UCMA 11754]
MPTDSSQTTTIRELASTHGLDIDPETINVNELGLDFQVAIAEAVDGQSWVLRIPRRPDVTDRAAVEGRFLRAIAPHLSVAVPNWQIHTEDLIAYPLLPGAPGLTIDDQGQPQWHFDVESGEYIQSLTDFLAELHSVDPALVRSSGIDEFSPAEVRQRKRDDIARVVAEFDVAQSLRERWAAWLDDDAFWPTFTTVTHGEVYPAHQLMDGARNLSILDWTTAAIGDPARDFMFHHASVSAQAFDATIHHYVEKGGQVWPKFAEHCGELFSTSPVELGLYALQTGDAGHIEAAKAQLNPTE